MAAVTGSGVWTNNDGLHIRYGRNASLDAKEGSPAQAGAFKVYEFEFDALDLPTTSVPERFLNRVPHVILPSGVLLQSATFIVTTAFAGATATLTIGMAQPDGTTIDADGIDATIAVTAIDAVGDTVACDGALIGTKLAADACVTVTVGTANFTAGQGKLILEVLHPEPA